MSSNKLPQLKVDSVLSLFSSQQFSDALDVIDLLTVDYPEDLVVCRKVYEHFKDFSPNIPLMEVVKFLDKNKQLLKLTSPFCEQGYKNMYQ